MKNLALKIADKAEDLILNALIAFTPETAVK